MTKYLVIRGLAAYAALVIILGIWGCKKAEMEGDNSKSAKSDRRAALIEVGQGAPPLRLKTQAGEFRFDGAGKRPVLMNFFSSWCKPCNNEAPVLQKAYEDFKGRVEFAGVAVQDSEEGLKGYVKSHAITYPAGLDEDGRIAADYTVYGLPKTIIVGRDGKIAFMYTGEVTPEMLKKELERVL